MCLLAMSVYRMRGHGYWKHGTMVTVKCPMATDTAKPSRHGPCPSLPAEYCSFTDTTIDIQIHALLMITALNGCDVGRTSEFQINCMLTLMSAGFDLKPQLDIQHW